MSAICRTFITWWTFIWMLSCIRNASKMSGRLLRKGGTMSLRTPRYLFACSRSLAVVSCHMEHLKQRNTCF